MRRAFEMRTSRDIPPAVRWEEGLLLSPQHFQEQARRLDRQIELHLDYAAPYHHGLSDPRALKIELRGDQIHVHQIEAVMPDRTIVSRDEGDPELKVGLRAAAARVKNATALMLYLTLPTEERGRPSVTRDPGDERGRFLAVERPSVLDDVDGGSEEVVPRIVPNLRLRADVEPPARFVSLPIARVRIDGERFVLDHEYVPPCLSVPVVSALGQQGLRIAGFLRRKAGNLADKVAALSLSSDRALIAELRRQIACLVSGLPELEARLMTGRAHPFELYTALMSAVGHVSGLARDPLPPELPPYDHDDIGAAFLRVERYIERAVEEGIVESFTEHPFRLEQGRFRLELSRAWQGKMLVLCVRGRRGAEEKDVMAWMNGAILAADSVVRELQASRSLGVRRDRTDRQGDLVAAAGKLLFEMDLRSPFLRLGEPLVLLNTEDPAAAAGPAEVVLYVEAAR
jgi:type VI secretion system protein ImpJ